MSPESASPNRGSPLDRVWLRVGTAPFERAAVWERTELKRALKLVSAIRREQSA